MVGMLIGKRVGRAIELDKSLREAQLPMAAPLLMETGRAGLGVGPECDIRNGPSMGEGWKRVGGQGPSVSSGMAEPVPAEC